MGSTPLKNPKSALESGLLCFYDKKGTLKKQKQDKHIGFVNHRLTSLLLKLLPFNSANGGVRQTDQLKHRAAFSTFTFIMQSNTTVINSFVMSLTLGSCTQTNENFKTLYDWTC